MKKLVNLTPHEINIIGGAKIAPSGTVARVSVQYSQVLYAPCEAKLMRASYGAVTGLPEPDGESLFVVSAMVRAAVPNRNDVASPGELRDGLPLGGSYHGGPGDVLPGRARVGRCSRVGPVGGTHGPGPPQCQRRASMMDALQHLSERMAKVRPYHPAVSSDGACSTAPLETVVQRVLDAIDSPFVPCGRVSLSVHMSREDRRAWDEYRTMALLIARLEVESPESPALLSLYKHRDSVDPIIDNILDRAEMVRAGHANPCSGSGGQECS